MHALQQDSMAACASTIQSDNLIMQFGAYVWVSARVIRELSAYHAAEQR